MRKQRSVAIVHQLIVLHAAALALLAGCQKPPQSGQTIRFTAVSQPAALTKVQYTGDKAGGSKERIDWVQGDAIRIYSSGAKASNDPSYTWADYAVTANGTADGAKSKASISVSSPQGGLTWGADDNTFYAIYPSPGGSADVAGTVRGTSGTPFNGTIPTAQEGTAISVKDLSNQSGPNINVYYPTNASAYHLAYKSLEEPAAEVPLDFSPAYTAFHISAGYKDTDMTIKSVTLKAASGNAVAGDFTAYYGGSAWNFGNPAYASGSNDAINFTFAGSNPVLSASNQTVEFVLYALPQNLTNLTLDFRVEIASVEKHRTLELKTAAAGTYHGHTYAAGESLVFNACKKSYIKGLLIPGSTWTVDDATPVVLRESVAPWDDNTQNPNYGTDLVVNASGLDEVNLSTHSYRFSIYEPEGKTWKIKVLNSSGAVVPGVTITRDNHPGTTDPISGTGELTGTIRKGNDAAPGLIEFSLSGSTGGSDCTLSFSVIADGKEYSINSEVVRGTWGSGYQYINLP